MAILGMGNALVDMLVKLDTDQPLADLGIVKGAMEMIDQHQMGIIQKTQEGKEMSQVPGGSVCNTMRAIARLGKPSGFIGKVAQDPIGDFYQNALTDAGVNPYLARTEGISGVSTILISPDGERTMATFLGPAPTIAPDDIREEILSLYEYMYVEGYLIVNEELVLASLEKAKKAGLKIVLDLSNFNIVNAFKPLLQKIIPEYVNILFANESEAEAFTGLPAKEAIIEMSKMADIVVVTLGKEGAMAKSGEEIIHVPAEGGAPVDTTGAGDNFAAGFLFGCASGISLENSARIGSILAGYVINEIGPQISSVYWDEIKLKVASLLS